MFIHMMDMTAVTSILTSICAIIVSVMKITNLKVFLKHQVHQFQILTKTQSLMELQLKVVFLDPRYVEQLQMSQFLG